MCVLLWSRMSNVAGERPPPSLIPAGGREGARSPPARSPARPLIQHLLYRTVSHLLLLRCL
jgi:hypothetical protein